MQRLGFDLSRPIAAAVFAGDEPPDRLVMACEEALARRAGPFLASSREDDVVAVLQPERPGFLASLRDAVAGRSDGAVVAGGGSLVPFEQLLRSLREALYALRLSGADGRPQAEFSDLGTYQLLLTLQDPDALRTFADSVLSPLDEYDLAHGTELVRSLRAFLERNARWESAARDLFVHRHTLRYRMHKVEELTARSLSSARDRMEFFLALRARDLLASNGDAVSSREASAPRPRKGPEGR
jgi:purine catabolism regulator